MSLETANLNSSDIPLHSFKMVEIWKQGTNILTVPNAGEEVEPQELSPTLGGAQHSKRWRGGGAAGTLTHSWWSAAWRSQFGSHFGSFLKIYT